MITIASYEDDFSLYYEREKRPVVLYGSGGGLERSWGLFPDHDLLCDINADTIRSIHGEKVFHPHEMERYKEPLYIIVTVIEKILFKKVCEYINTLDLDCVVFHYYDNVGFCQSYWKSSLSYYFEKPTKPLRVNLVCAEPYWILHKFAIRMQEQLEQMDVQVTLSDNTVSNVDINHHIQFATFCPYDNDTLMISHVDSWKLFCTLKKQLTRAKLGICMSRETMERLVCYGIPRNKMCYINPAHDAVIKPRKYVIGITHRTYEWDLRKRTSSLLDIVKGIDPNYFHFIIMGSGWERIVDELKKMEYEVDYYSQFDLDIYQAIMPEFDFYMYTGFDEGSMGYLDAIAAGVGTMVTPQGFHLDNHYPIDYPCRTVKDFHCALLDLQKKRLEKVKSVEQWTWESYAKKHLTIWEYLLNRKPLGEVYSDQLCYEDGIYSMLLEDNRIPFSAKKSITR